MLTVINSACLYAIFRRISNKKLSQLSNAGHCFASNLIDSTITKILVPFKDTTTKRLNLPVDQVSLHKHDLHYSHKTTSVLKLLQKHHIKVLSVPTRYTDEIQERDTVINKRLKLVYERNLGIIYNDFKCFKGEPSEWSIELIMGSLKDHIVSFVEILSSGMNIIRAESYATVIRSSFKSNGMFELIRGSMRQIEGREKLHL